MELDEQSNTCIYDMSVKQKQNKQVELYQTEKPLHSKGNHPENKKTTHNVGEYIRK